MLMPVGEDVRIPVDVVFPTLVPLRMVPGWITRRDGDVIHLELAEPTPVVSEGTRIILDGGRSQGERVLARTVGEASGARMVVSYESTSVSDQRASGRTSGLVDLGYRVIRDDEPELVRRWLEDGWALPDPRAWDRPEPEVEFSLSGLKFRDVPRCSVGERLLIEMLLPTTATVWRCTGRVRRVDEVEDGQQDVADEFVDLGEDVQDALIHYILHLSGVPR